ncbi:MAG: hypothetical protein J7L07_12045 [Candidatus Odinarchaeota archaeon]|nr:hypothetical protein [Candidatus Odinarchaeota archaeon]
MRLIKLLSIRLFIVLESTLLMKRFSSFLETPKSEAIDEFDKPYRNMATAFTSKMYLKMCFSNDVFSVKCFPHFEQMYWWMYALVYPFGFPGAPQTGQCITGVLAFLKYLPELGLRGSIFGIPMISYFTNFHRSLAVPKNKTVSTHIMLMIGLSVYCSFASICSAMEDVILE